MMSSSSRVVGPQLRDALSCLETVVLDGVSHGFFSCTVTCEIVGGRRREVVIKAGKSRKFTIPKEEVPE
jgi:hypothetical protein